jgi:hypothetical protein
MMADKKPEDKKPEDKKPDDGGRTKYIDRKMPAGTGKDILMGVSRMADKMGLRQDKKYEGKSDEELATKKAKGGAVKYKKGGVTRGDGIAKRGHTKGRMV